MYLILRACKKQAQGSQLIYTLRNSKKNRHAQVALKYCRKCRPQLCNYRHVQYIACKSNECYIFYKSLKCKYPDAD